jgi:hypothetical protein
MRDPLTLANDQDILEVLDDCFGHTSTIVIAKMPVAEWFSQIPNLALADAFLDHLVNPSYRFSYKARISGNFVLHLGPCRTPELEHFYQSVSSDSVRHDRNAHHLPEKSFTNLKLVQKFHSTDMG